MTRRVWHSHICLVLVLGRTALLPVVGGRADPWSTVPNRWYWFLTSELLCRKQRETTALLSPVQTVIMNLNNKTMNSVNGTITTGNGASLGRKLYEPQVHSDRHLATAKKSLHTGTRNVRSPFRLGQLENIKEEMDIKKTDILGILLNSQDWSWKISIRHVIYYSDGEEHACMLDSLR